MRTIQDLRRDEKNTQSLRSRSGVIFFFLLILIISGVFKILQLTVLDRVDDIAVKSDGIKFSPQNIENKLKFFPTILEVVVLGDRRDMCTAIVNIDLTAVGNWAERNNIAYSSYQELAANPDVYEMVKEHIDEVILSVSKDKMLASCQIHRFLILHKELDADDGEITRTRKVRRGAIADKYSDLVSALYSGKNEITLSFKFNNPSSTANPIAVEVKLLLNECIICGVLDE